MRVEPGANGIFGNQGCEFKISREIEEYINFFSENIFKSADVYK